MKSDADAKSSVSPAKDVQSQSAFTDALKKVATASSASSRDAIRASKATKPSLHTRFVYSPAKGRA